MYSEVHLLDRIRALTLVRPNGTHYRVFVLSALVFAFTLSILFACSSKGGGKNNPPATENPSTNPAQPGGTVSDLPASSNTLANPNAVWLAAEATLLKLDASAALISAETLSSTVTQIAVDAESGAVWALAGATLNRYAPGATKTSANLAAPQPDADTRMAVIARSGAVWISRGTSLSLIDATGAIIASAQPSGAVAALAADARNGLIWAATSDYVTAFDGTTGSAKMSLPLPNGFVARHIAFDESLDALWVANASTLALYASDGSARLPALDIALPGITQLEGDGKGNVWVGTPQQILSFSNSGSQRFAIDLKTVFSGNPALVGLGANIADQSAWATTASQLVRIDTNGVAGSVTALKQKVAALSVFADAKAPKLKLIAPANNAYVNTATPTLVATIDDVGSGLDPSTAQIVVDGNGVAGSCEIKSGNLECVPGVALSQGGANIKLNANDFGGNEGASDAVFVTIDTIPPQITLNAPARGLVTNASSVPVTGKISEAANLTFNAQALTIDVDNAFSTSLNLVEGINSFTLTATDLAGNQGELNQTVIRDSIPPASVPRDHLTLSTIVNGNLTVTGSAGAAEAGATVTITNTRTNVSVTVVVAADGSFTSPTLVAINGDVLSVVVSDAASNMGPETKLTAGTVTTPDPGTIAPPVDPTVATDIHASTSFLYEGPNAIQTGVAPGTIDAQRVVILRGKVTNRPGDPLDSVKVTVLGHPEFGQTYSRADGMFDLAVNGGGDLTLNFERGAFLPAQRTVTTPWRDFVAVPDVALVPLDTAVTTIDLSANAMQVARGNSVTDADGSRQATVVVPTGTTASMVMPDGSSQSLSTLHLRATEYTVGANGPKAMPAALPPTSGYTYAVEYSVDEAIEAGATTVMFNQALPAYVENFVGFPVGTIVPSGYYDRAKAQWIPSDNGRVLKVLSVSNNLADLDVDGKGLAADAVALSALGIGDAERAQIAQLYSAGQTFWRVPVMHFTTYDFNWGIRFPNDAIAPLASIYGDPPISDQNVQCGSVIGCENQTLGESVPVNGTSLRMHYQSERTPGRKTEMSIPLSGSTVPASLKVIDLDIDIAGQKRRLQFNPAPDLKYDFAWDGKDVYGRDIFGTQSARIRVSYTYAAVYVLPDEQSGSVPAFGLISDRGIDFTGDRAALTISLSREYTASFDHWDNRSLGMGGWSLSVHHALDAPSRLLLLGDGTTIHGDAVTAVSTVVNKFGGYYGISGEGGPAANATVLAPVSVAVGPDRSYYIATTGRVMRVDPNGIFTGFAGTTGGNSGDGGPATSAKMGYVSDVAVGPDGSVYIADITNHVIRRVTPDGIINTIAGTGVGGFSGDGGLAINAQLASPKAIAVGPDGALYIADTGNHRIRRIGNDGVILTLAGDGVRQFAGDGGPASKARLTDPRDLVVGPDGSIYIAEDADYNVNRVRKISPDGIINTFAGNGGRPSDGSKSDGDGGPAINAQVNPYGLAIAPDGALFIVDEWNGSNGGGRVRRVGTDGVITTVLGTGQIGFNGDDRAATDTQLNRPNGIALSPDGSLYVADTLNHRIRRLAPEYTGYSIFDTSIPSEDGSEVYVFDPKGHHIKTIDALNGATRYEFGYDASGYLTSITDGSSNVTTIERTGALATAIVAPGGQRTALNVSSAGWLQAATNPAAESFNMTYSSDGLLQSFVDPRGYIHRLTYDAQGRLTKDEDPAGGSTSLTRTEQTNGYTVTTTSALGRTHSYQVESLTTGAVRRTVTATDGTKAVTLISTDLSELTTYADGSTLSVAYAPDPRFGITARFPSKIEAATPGGLKRTITTTRSAVLADAKNLFSLTKLTTSVSDNGAVSASVYNNVNGVRTVTYTSAAARSSSVTLDDLGRITKGQVSGLDPVSYTYDTRGLPTAIAQGNGTNNRNSSLAYDAAYRLIGATDPLGRTLAMTYDSADRIVSEKLPGDRTVTFSYDASGNMTALTPPGKTAHSFEYTSIDQTAKYTPPDLNGTSTVTQYTYDNDRALSKLARPDAKNVDVTYDSAGRASSVSIARGAYSYSYDTTTGNLTSITAPQSLGLAYSYDGDLTTGITWSGSVSGSTAYTYNNDMLVTAESINGANEVSYAYDVDRLLKTAGDLSLTRNAQNGLLTGTVLNKVADAYSYSSFGEATTYNVKFDAAALYDVAYTRDALGRITKKVETIGGVTTTYDYGYDSAGRLSTVGKDGAQISSYSYDSNGNRIARTGPSVSATYDDQDRLISYGGTTYSYTANGELSSKTTGSQTTSYQYDEMGNLLKVILPDGTVIDYLIDGQNRRVGKKVNGNLVQGFLYQGQLRPVAELDDNNAVVSRFVYGTRVNVPDYMVKNGTTYRIVTDQIGSPRLVVDVATGAVAQRIDYDEFGRILSDTSPGFQPFGFAGGLYDLDTQLVRFGVRDYDPMNGRWLSKDPVLFSAKSTNVFSYADSEPINLFDPSGLDGMAISELVSAPSASALSENSNSVQFALDYSAPAPPGARVVVTDLSSGSSILGVLQPGGGIDLDDGSYIPPSNLNSCGDAATSVRYATDADRIRYGIRDAVLAIPSLWTKFKKALGGGKFEVTTERGAIVVRG